MKISFCPSRLIIFLCVTLLVSPLPASANPHEYLLDNGLKLVIKEDHRSPVVIQQVWYKAGSMDEVNGTTGVAHALEHMMFKGTDSVPTGEFSRRIAAVGGKENAFTSSDYTAYYQQLHQRHLPMAMELESDRMHNLRLTQEEFAKEIQVVMEERRLRTDDQAHALLYEKLMATAFQAHPYRRPIIGWMNDLEHMQVSDAQDWYKRWYAPNNAVLVVVGDVDPESVLALAKKYYGRFSAGKIPSLSERKPQIEPPQIGIKRLVVKAPAKLPHLIMGYKVPVLKDPKNDWEPYALTILAEVLDGNAAARLNKALVRETRVAISADAGYSAIERGPGTFYIDGTPSEGRTADELEQSIRTEIDKIIQSGITQEELARVKAQVVASRIYQLDSTFAQAMQIGRLESIGLSHRDADIILERLQAVTAEQVRNVAEKYLIDDSLTVAVLDPQPLSETSSSRNSNIELKH
ncbi:zinc protease [Nitrosomonas eutropha]|uniref:M16 family metallopeptidase n=1 Tax=Nitrosomonas TaxID=914 RepID=UPI00087E2165|nr:MULTISPECIES: pitrilysin family protein [Nitrosomonas]MXS80271.1 insulinase family protein [Nitrosomonas sp. GH22]SCX00362.1 zinc protease [Nitrosomonas eutropha]SDW32540.1 zinc protease [Nitrosomonas eutropha]